MQSLLTEAFNALPAPKPQQVAPAAPMAYLPPPRNFVTEDPTIYDFQIPSDDDAVNANEDSNHDTSEHQQATGEGFVVRTQTLLAAYINLTLPGASITARDVTASGLQKAMISLTANTESAKIFLSPPNTWPVNTPIETVLQNKELVASWIPTDTPGNIHIQEPNVATSMGELTTPWISELDSEDEPLVRSQAPSPVSRQRRRQEVKSRNAVKHKAKLWEMRTKIAEYINTTLGASLTSEDVTRTGLRNAGISTTAKTPRADILLEKPQKWPTTLPLEDILAKREYQVEWFSNARKVNTTSSRPDANQQPGNIMRRINDAQLERDLIRNNGFHADKFNPTPQNSVPSNHTNSDFHETLSDPRNRSDAPSGQQIRRGGLPDFTMDDQRDADDESGGNELGPGYVHCSSDNKDYQKRRKKLDVMQRAIAHHINAMLPGAQVNAAHIVPSRIEAKGIHLHAKTPRAALLLEHWSKWRVTVPVEDILQRKELVAEWILGHNPNRGAEVLTTESTPDREDTSQQDDGVEIISAQTEFKASESEDGEQTSSTVPNTPELEDGTQASAPVSSTPEPEAGMPNSPTMPVAPKPKDVMDISCAHTEDDEVTHPVPEVEVQPRDISESTVPRPTSQSLDSSVDIQPFDCDEIGESCFPTTEQLKAEHKRKYGEIPEIFEWTFPFWAEVEKHRIVAQNYHVMGKRMKSRIEELERQVKKLKQENGALKIR